MSASFCLSYKTAHRDYNAEVESFNITYNLSEMFNKITEGSRISDWLKEHDNFKASDIILAAETILVKLEDNPSLAELNPSNEWGSYDNLLETWKKFVKVLKEHPQSRLSSWV